MKSVIRLLLVKLLNRHITTKYIKNQKNNINSENYYQNRREQIILKTILSKSDFDNFLLISDLK